MIICFSGTGNTRSVADHLSKILGDEVLRLPPGLMREPEKIRLKVPDGRLIWSFPIHAWGLPSTVDKVIKKMQLFAPADIVHHFVCTCGDDIGCADKEWRTEIAARGWRTGGAFSVQMPNNYVALPGFDVDSDQLAREKLERMPRRVESVASLLESGKYTTDVVRGRCAWLKTYFLGWLFRHFFTGIKRFHVSDACMGCGKCARNCPLNCIEMRDRRPSWNGDCTMCLRCYHLCPCHALDYGRHTSGKGQYIHPDFQLK